MYTLNEVSKHYRQGTQRVRAVDSLSLTIDRGQFVVVEGASGSGKSTLLQLLGGLDRPSEGRLCFEEHELSTLPDRRLADLRLRAFGFVFQQFNLIPTLTAGENVEAAMAPSGVARGERRRRTAELLDQVGLADRVGHLPSELSGGEQQRVAIARALANRPRVLLADEPTGNLDTATGEGILDLLTGLWRTEALTIVLVTHDTRISARATRLVRMLDGAVARDPAPVS